MVPTNAWTCEQAILHFPTVTKQLSTLSQRMIRIDWSRLMDLITDVFPNGRKRPRKRGMSLEFMWMFYDVCYVCQPMSRSLISTTIAALHHGGYD